MVSYRKFKCIEALQWRSIRRFSVGFSRIRMSRHNVTKGILKKAFHISESTNDHFQTCIYILYCDKCNVICILQYFTFSLDEFWVLSWILYGLCCVLTSYRCMHVCINPLLHTDDIWRLLLQTTFENIAIKGEIARNEQFHLLLQYFQLFINIIYSIC